MFDIFGVVNPNGISKNAASLSYGKNIPADVEHDSKEYQSDWYFIRCSVYKDNILHWHKEADNIEVFILGQIFFRFDSPFSNTALDGVLDRFIALYKEQGKDVTRHIKGNYIAFIIDKSSKNLEIITSASCLYDLYYVTLNRNTYFSTSLENLLALDSDLKETNPTSLVEYCLFDYPLGNKSLFSKISWLDQGSYCTFGLQKTDTGKWFKWEDFVLKQKQDLAWSDAYAQIPELFNKTLSQQLEGKPGIISALTGGFDSRTVLSGLLHLGCDKAMYYAWGKPESYDLKISAKISSKLAQKHSSLVLNKEYEQSFVSKGEQAIRSSDGRATLRRANHFYSYGKLAEYSHYNFTGIFGSELLRPISAIGHTFNKNFLKMLLSANPEQAIKDIINDLNGKRYLNQRYLLTVQNEVIDDVLNYFRDLKKDLPIHLVLYIFHLQEGFRKYFGHEIHGTRFFVTTYSPYIDDEFIRFILSTPVLSLNKKAIELNFKKDMWNIRLGQLLYIPIIKTNYPALMNFITGRFCTPAQLASRFFPLSIAPAMIPYKLNRMFSSFGTENWINLFIDKHRNLSKLDSDLFVPLAPYDKSAFEDYAKQMSLRYWLNHVS